MNIEELMSLDIADRATASYKKVRDLQDKLNASITFIEPMQAHEGKLAGIPVALKDNISIKGIKTTAASDILDNYVPIYDATIVEKLRDSGAVFVCKSSMDELAMGGTNRTANIGPCLNPHDTSRISGGSSGGSAALVASGAVPLAIGTDTGDSIRKPASFCGIVGVKPTYGRISRYGIIPYASSLDHVGYFTTNVEDAALALEVLAGHDEKDMTSCLDESVLEYSKLIDSNVKDKKILVFGNVIRAISDSTILEQFNKVVDGLKKKGAITKEVYFDDDLMKCIFPTYFIIANAEATANHANLDGVRFGHRVDGDSMEEVMMKTRTRGFSSFIKKRFVIGSYSLFLENQDRLLKKAQKIRRLIVDSMLKELTYADAIIAPSSGSIAPKLLEKSTDELSDEYLIAENHMVIGNFGGFPSMSLPMGFKDDMPIGIHLMCKTFSEEKMFGIAKAIEDITGLKNATKEVL